MYYFIDMNVVVDLITYIIVKQKVVQVMFYYNQLNCVFADIKFHLSCTWNARPLVELEKHLLLNRQSSVLAKHLQMVSYVKSTKMKWNKQKTYLLWRFKATVSF